MPSKCCQLGCQPRLMLNVIFRIRVAGRLRRVWRWRLSRRQRWAPLLELPLVIITVVVLRGRTSNHAFRLRRHADALPSLLQGLPVLLMYRQGAAESATRRDEAGSRKCLRSGSSLTGGRAQLESCPSIQDPALGSDGALPGVPLARSWRWRASLQPRFDFPVHRMVRRRRCLLSR